MLFHPPSALETCCQLQGFQLAPSLFKILSIDRTSSRKIQEGSTMAATSVDMVKMICFRFSFQNFHRLLTQYFANTAYRPHSGNWTSANPLFLSVAPDYQAYIRVFIGGVATNIHVAAFGWDGALSWAGKRGHKESTRCATILRTDVITC